MRTHASSASHICRIHMSLYMYVCTCIHTKHARKQVAAFIKSVGKVTWVHCNTLCHNLGRQRRRIMRSVDDWADLQTKSEELDAKVVVVMLFRHMDM